MTSTENFKPVSAIFITFSGNCKKALTFYQSCFGGTLHVDTLDKELEGFPEKPVITGSLISSRIVIHGSDLVPNEGRKLGNHLAIFFPCQDVQERRSLVDKLNASEQIEPNDVHLNLVELVDHFGVRWILGV